MKAAAEPRPNVRRGGEAPAARLFGLMGALAAGVVVAGWARPGAQIAFVAGAGALTIAVRKRRTGFVWLLVGAIGLGFALAGARLASVEDGALARGGARRADAILEGTALDDGRVRLGAARFTLGVGRAEIDGEGARVRERVLVTIRPAPATPVRAGDRMRVDARLGPLRFADMDAAGRASAARLERRGVSARAFVSPAGVQPLAPANGLLDSVARAGRDAVRRVAARLPASARGLLLGVTIGDTSALDPQVEVDFRVTGLSHLVAVSGANVAMVLAVVALVLHALRAGRRTTVIAMCAATLGFCAITRFEPSVMRAGAMAAVGLTGVALGARRRTVVALAAASLALVVIDPFLVQDAGFQLSVLATIGILMVAPRIREMLPAGRLGDLAAVTLGAQLAVAPLLIVSFGSLSLASIAANIVVLPCVAPATVIGLVAAALGALWHPLASIGIAAVPPIAWMQWSAHAMAQLPLASISTPSGALGLIAAVLAAAAVIAFARGRRPRRAASVVLAVAVVATAGVWARALSPPPLRGLVVTMIDVGQGDALLVRSQGRAMLIDGGPDPAALTRALAEHGVHRLDLLVMTHPHADHIDGLASLAERFPISRALDPMFDDDLPSYGRFKDALARRGIPRDRARAGAVYVMGGARIDVLWPRAELMTGTDADVNNNSIVLRVSFGADVVLFSGEVQEEAMAELLDDAGALTADVVKVSHHGSARMLPAFYAATGARLALIPVGSNTFGHPAPPTLAALRSMRIERTDRAGTVSVALDGRDGLTIRTDRG